jgi:Membrane-bound serine protease (ClpP class)
MRRLLLAVSLLLLAPAAFGAGTEVVVVDVDTDINPVTAEFLKRVFEEAAAEGAPAVVLRINTPGGRLDSTREITKSILSSEVPVIGFVHPPGSQAASAGFIILMACDVAAMAPGTNAGAASPVGGGGEELPKTIGKKVSEDAAALVRSLVVPRGRPVDDAVKTISDALSYSESEAKAKGLVEIIARDVPDLLKQLDGRPIKRVGKPDATLASGAFTSRTVSRTPLEKALGVIASPMVAGLLFLIGIVGLYSEFQNPGAILPGVLGSICLLLAFFAMSVLPTNWVGIGLVLLGVLFFFLEVKLTTTASSRSPAAFRSSSGRSSCSTVTSSRPRPSSGSSWAGRRSRRSSSRRSPSWPSPSSASPTGPARPSSSGRGAGPRRRRGRPESLRRRRALGGPERRTPHGRQLVEVTGVDGLAVLVKPTARSEKS